MYISAKISPYSRDIDKTKYVFFDKRWWIIRKIQWNSGKVKNSFKKEFDSEPVYNEKYLKAKIKSYNQKINTNFCSNKIPKESSKFICLSVILIHPVFRTGKNCFPWVFV